MPEDRSARPLSKTAQLLIERAARKQARLDKKASDAQRLQAARDRAEALGRSMPPEYQQWGVVRTRAYVRLLEIVKAKAQNKTAKPEQLEGYLAALAGASEWTLDYCQHIAALHARAVDISEPEEAEA